MTKDKKQLGQFYTTNYEYIFQNMFIPNKINNIKVVKIVEPFAGNADLLNFIKEKNNYIIKCYDIIPNEEKNIEKRNTLLEPPDYTNVFILTNPPFLARNKSDMKELYDKYDTNDLYKCFIHQLLETDTLLGGIIILPLNFWCSIRKRDISLRRKFIKTYSIKQLNIFEETVFNDTSYTVCSIMFEKKCDENSSQNIKTTIYPMKKEIDIVFNDENNYTFGGEIYNLPLEPTLKIDRLTKKNINKYNDACITNILVKCIDDTKDSMICMKYIDDIKERYIDDTSDNTARSYMTLIIEPHITIERQKELVEKFNKYIDEMREKYCSLFLTQFRNSNSIARKRISFGLVYNIVNFLLTKI